MANPVGSSLRDVRFPPQAVGHLAPHEPHAVRLFLNDFDDTLVFYQFDRQWWDQIKSTNILERLLREVRRRVRLVDSFRDETSCQTIVYGILQLLTLVPGEHPQAITQNS